MSTAELYKNIGDDQLASRIAEGDEQAFGELYLRSMPSLVKTGRKLLKSEAAVADVIQETLLRLWVHREKLRTVESPRAWVWRIFSNECFRYLKKNGLKYIPIDFLPDFYTASLPNTAEQACSLHETGKLVQHAVASLSPRQREIFTLSRELGLKIPEIADRLGLSYKYVKKTLGLALHHVRRDLIRSGKSLLMLGIMLLFK